MRVSMYKYVYPTPNETSYGDKWKIIKFPVCNKTENGLLQHLQYYNIKIYDSIKLNRNEIHEISI